MKNMFNKTLWFMTSLVAVLIGLVCVFRVQFMELVSANYVINGIIIGTGIFGIGLCIYEMFRLVPEYTWLDAYTKGHRTTKLPPRILHQIATVLQKRPCRIYSDALSGMMDMIANKFDNARESIRFITNALILIGLLGTLWGLATTLGNFGELIYGMDINNLDTMTSIEMAGPINGMAMALTCSVLGLGFCLLVALFGHLVGLAQNVIYTELGDYMAAHTHATASANCQETIPHIDLGKCESTNNK